MKCDAENQIKAKRGEDLPWAKITEHDVRLIRQIHREGREQMERIRATCGPQALAEKFGLHQNTIHKIVSYQIWRHVKD